MSHLKESEVKLQKFLNKPERIGIQSDELQYVPPRPVSTLSVLNNHIRARQLYQESREFRATIYLHTVTLYTASGDKRTAVNGWGTEIDAEKALVFYGNIPTVCPKRLWTGRK